MALLASEAKSVTNFLAASCTIFERSGDSQAYIRTHTCWHTGPQFLFWQILSRLDLLQNPASWGGLTQGYPLIQETTKTTRPIREQGIYTDERITLQNTRMGKVGKGIEVPTRTNGS